MTDQTYSGVDNLEVMEEARNYNRFLVEVVLAASDEKRAVDFGAGMGTIAVPVRERGRQLSCVEVDSELGRSLTEKGFQVVGSLAELPKGGARYIYSVNVLEHIEDDVAALRDLFETLSPGGTLLLYVPAFPILFSAMDHKIGHYRRYRLGSLRHQLEQVGFRVEDGRYVDSLGFFATLVYKLIGNRNGDIDPRAVGLYDRWLFPSSRLIDRLTGKWFGKNVVVRASRP